MVTLVTKMEKNEDRENERKNDGKKEAQTLNQK
jgi:hypothetical protein